MNDGLIGMCSKFNDCRPCIFLKGGQPDKKIAEFHLGLNEVNSMLPWLRSVSKPSIERGR